MIPVLALLFSLQADSLAQRRETTQESFVARAKRVQWGATTNTLVTSLEFPAQEARFVRLFIRRSYMGEPCLDEIEIYSPDSLTNLALAGRGAVARASSLLPGYSIHAVAHLNDGSYGNDHSWIAATAGEEWAEIELPGPARINRVLFSRDRNGRFMDRQVLEAEVRLSSDGQTWRDGRETHASRQPTAPSRANVDLSRSGVDRAHVECRRHLCLPARAGHVEPNGCQGPPFAAAE